VASENNIAWGSGQSRFGYVADGAPQNSVRIALNDDGFQLKTRDLNLANYAAFHEGSRRFFDAGVFEFGLFVGLKSVSIDDDISGIAQGDKADSHKEVRSYAGDVGT
jgi:hypothetical protein